METIKVKKRKNQQKNVRVEKDCLQMSHQMTEEITSKLEDNSIEMIQTHTEKNPRESKNYRTSVHSLTLWKSQREKNKEDRKIFKDRKVGAAITM